MRRVGRALAGAVLGGAVTVALAVLLAMVGNISQAEEAYAMGVAFFWVPLGALVGLVAGLVTGR